MNLQVKCSGSVPCHCAVGIQFLFYWAKLAASVRLHPSGGRNVERRCPNYEFGHRRVAYSS